jgi:hypothetical protein
MSSVDVEVEGLFVPQVQVKVRSHRPVRRSGRVDGSFLRGPIPLAWLNRVYGLAGQKTLQTALAIWFLAGLRRRNDRLRLTSDVMAKFGVTDRSAKYRALEKLERAGIIHVHREPRKNPVVAILDAGVTWS